MDQDPESDYNQHEYVHQEIRQRLKSRVRRLTDEIERLERDAAKAGRAYTLIAGPVEVALSPGKSARWRTASPMATRAQREYDRDHERRSR